MTVGSRNGVGIPRLQELEFVGLAVEGVVSGSTYDEIRASLFNHMAYTRQQNAPSGNHAGTRTQQDPLTRYVHNATEALTEAMRLGFVERAQLPASKKAAGAYARVRFVATDLGRAWARRQMDDPAAAYTDLIARLWELHPQFRGYLDLLARGPFVIPTANWREVHERPVRAGQEDAARSQYIDFLAARCARAITAGATGWTAAEREIGDAVREYIEARVAFSVRRERPHPYPRHGDFVSACEEAVVSYAFTRAEMALDYISQEILRRWTRTLGIANFSYHVPDAPALRLWPTAAINPPPTLQVERHSATEFRDAVLHLIPDVYERARQRVHGASFVPIHLVRSGVCFRLQLNDGVFDAAVREMLSGQHTADVGYRISLDRAQYGAIPPTEQPLRVPDHRGRQQTYTVMTLVNRPERTAP